MLVGNVLENIYRSLKIPGDRAHVQEWIIMDGNQIIKELEKRKAIAQSFPDISAEPGQDSLIAGTHCSAKYFYLDNYTFWHQSRPDNSAFK